MLRRPLGTYLRLRLYCFSLLIVLLSGIPEGRAQLLLMGQVPSTCGASNGSIIVDASNYGTAPYRYFINNIQYTPCTTNKCTIPNLKGGQSYPIDVYDKNNIHQTYFGGYYLVDLAGPQIVISSIIPATCLNNDGGLVISQTGGNPPFTYSINGVDYVAFGTFRGVANGPLTATVRDINMCPSSQTVTIPLMNDLVLSTRSGPPICEGTAVKLQAGGNGQKFSWSPAAGLNDPTLLTPLASPSTTTPYTLTATRGVCTLTASETVTVNPAPVANAGGPDVVTCYGKSLLLHGSGGTTYRWSPITGLTNPNVAAPIVVNPIRNITYALSVTDAKGCSSLKPDSVNVVVTPPLKVVASPDTIVYVGQPVHLSVVGPSDPGTPSYSWSPAVGLNNPFIQNPIAVLTSPEQVAYVVQMTSSSGCTGTDTVVIKAFSVADIIVPNAFSPNNDGHNDVLRPKMPGIKIFKYFTVFDRWGHQIFTTTNAGIGWDGTLNGRVLDAGVYVWMAMGVDVGGRVVQRKGTVVLVR